MGGESIEGGFLYCKDHIRDVKPKGSCFTQARVPDALGLYQAERWDINKIVNKLTDIRHLA